jgi:hypothetical protein
VEEYASNVLWSDHGYVLGAKEVTVFCTTLDVMKRLYVSTVTSTSDEAIREKG